jgi:uncharacterized protein (DUF983 family)
MPKAENSTPPKPSYLWSLINNKCPRCRKGELYLSKNPLNLAKVVHMHERCKVCGQRSEIEVGFYYGTAYLSYVLTLLFSGIYFFVWWLFIGISVYDNRIYWWFGSNVFILVVTQPLVMRFSRTLWLYFFVKYNGNWQFEKPKDYERIVEEHMGNW